MRQRGSSGGHVLEPTPPATWPGVFVPHARTQMRDAQKSWAQVACAASGSGTRSAGAGASTSCAALRARTGTGTGIGLGSPTCRAPPAPGPCSDGERVRATKRDERRNETRDEARQGKACENVGARGAPRRLRPDASAPARALRLADTAQRRTRLRQAPGARTAQAHSASARRWPLAVGRRRRRRSGRRAARGLAARHEPAASRRRPAAGRRRRHARTARGSAVLRNWDSACMPPAA